MDKNSWFRRIPKVDVLLETKEVTEWIRDDGRPVVMEAIREETAALRKKLETCEKEEEAEKAFQSLLAKIRKRILDMTSPQVKQVINGTGVILHTNLGRAPIAPEQARRISEIVTGYSNLEYDLEKGERGERYSHFSKLLCRLTGAEACMVVNNNAAAVLLALSTIATGGEVITSRGELVEIGGKFRIPDVCAQGGARLVEVGTTNKTHLSDYAEAITEETRAILKVHTSNYRIVGFSELVEREDLKRLASQHDLPLIEDLGSGVLVDLSKYGLSYEPTVQDSVKAGVDVVCFSGDKLLGGPQAGIIVGRKKWIDKMKKHPLTRALRVDKFTVTALEMVLLDYLDEERAVKKIPVLKMIRESEEALQKKAEALKKQVDSLSGAADFAVLPCEEQIGGGSLPLERLQGYALVIRPKRISVPELEEKMRHLPVPIIGRTIENAVWLDVRTMFEEDFGSVSQMLGEIL